MSRTEALASDAGSLPGGPARGRWASERPASPVVAADRMRRDPGFEALDQPVALAPGVHWIGVCDSKRRVFDITVPTPRGTTYNAYVVRGRDGVAIIDTVRAEFAAAFFAKLEAVARYDEIRAIVLNHLEPDHSGAVAELLRRAPDATLYISGRGRPMLKGLLHTENPEFVAAATGSTINLGERTLYFLQTPYLHWPDTQCTWLVEDGILFSGDIFGSHFASPHRFDDEIGDFSGAFSAYFSDIMRPFKKYVLQALDLIEPLAIRVLAPSHGPILRDRPQQYLHRYRALAEPATGEKGGLLAIFYLSAYGSTAAMAEAIAHGARTRRAMRVVLHDLADEGGGASAVDLIEQADGVLIGSPTINGDAVKPVWELLASLGVIALRGKLAGAFGSYGWTGEAVRMIEERLRALKFNVAIDGLRARLVPSAEELAACRQFGSDFSARVLGSIRASIAT